MVRLDLTRWSMSGQRSSFFLVRGLLVSVGLDKLSHWALRQAQSMELVSAANDIDN